MIVAGSKIASVADRRSYSLSSSVVLDAARRPGGRLLARAISPPSLMAATGSALGPARQRMRKRGGIDPLQGCPAACVAASLKRQTPRPGAGGITLDRGVG
jgi:hypothetical protein